jgi:4'-phosphopantetheinyl transferase EntD
MTTALRTATPARPGFRQLLDERILVAERRIAHVVGEVERHRLEHLVGRDLGSHLMRQLEAGGDAPLGIDTPIGRGTNGEPLFPSGVVGSIAHSAGLVAAAVATRRSGVLAVGLDVHPATPLPGDVGDIVGGGRELRGAPALAAQGMATSVLFSAKECVFKAWFPLTGSWLEYEDVTVRLRDDGTFRVDDPATPGLWHGRWQIADGMIRSAATITWREF